MNVPFPGMDPYLEHPVLWEGLHARLVVAIANRLQPLLDPRYVASVEERVYIEGPQRRIPDVWIQRTVDDAAQPAVATAEPRSSGVVIVEVDELELHETRVEILDAYNEMKLVTLIELVSPTNKWPGPGRQSYLEKQQEVMARDCNLVEIDLLRNGRHVAAVPDWRLRDAGPLDYLACVNRWSNRKRYELYPMRLREPLAEIDVPLSAPDPDVSLPLQETFDQVYEEGRYYRRVRYDERCEPALPEEDQLFAWERWREFREANPNLFPS